MTARSYWPDLGSISPRMRSGWHLLGSTPTAPSTPVSVTPVWSSTPALAWRPPDWQPSAWRSKQEAGFLLRAIPSAATVSQAEFHPGILRFNEDGSVDSTFANPGFGGSLFYGDQDSLFSLDIETNGDIVAAGNASPSSNSIAVARLTADGQPDPTFGSAGVETIDPGRHVSLGGVTGLAIDPSSGRIVVGATGGSLSGLDFVVTRLDADGSPDPSFNQGAAVSFDFTSVGADTVPETALGSLSAVLVQPDGKVVLVGSVTLPVFSVDEEARPDVFALARLNADGTLDTGFGTGGKVLNNDLAADAGSGILQADGNIVVAGGSADGFTMARYLGAAGTAIVFPPVLSPPQVGPIATPAPPVGTSTTVIVSASFTYTSSRGPCTAVWNWSDGTTSAGTVTESNGSGSVSGSHVYHAGGVYPVTVTVTDSGGGSGQSTAIPGVVVWQPVTGSITGSIHLISPRGALPSEPVGQRQGHARARCELQPEPRPRGQGLPQAEARALELQEHRNRRPGFEWQDCLARRHGHGQRHRGCRVSRFRRCRGQWDRQDTPRALGPSDGSRGLRQPAGRGSGCRSHGDLSQRDDCASRSKFAQKPKKGDISHESCNAGCNGLARCARACGRQHPRGWPFPCVPVGSSTT